jgi:thiamine-monophosphate kinase
MDLSEEDLLSAIARVLSGAGPEVVVGVGDDAAVVAPGAGQLVLTTDAMVEGTHFSLATTSARDLGHKAIVVNVSDIAAMAASPRFALCALTLSDSVDAAWTIELLGGMREACNEYALWLVGGNLAAGPQVSVAVTVTGEVAPGRAVKRSGARPGDRIVVTGSLGGSAAGLRVAHRGGPLKEGDRPLLEAHFRPVARVGEAAVLSQNEATAMIDVSDGLSLDLSRVCVAAGVGARIRMADIPVAAGATLEEALGGGEDYELLATLPDAEAVTRASVEIKQSFGVALTDIGEIVEGAAVIVTDGASERALEPTGWDHFAAPS